MKEKKLSTQQKDILLLLEEYQRTKSLSWYGFIPLRSLKRSYYATSSSYIKLSQSKAASFSRSIRRLEKRGLIYSHKVTRKKLKEGESFLPQRVFIELTKKGSQIVKEIKGYISYKEYVNRIIAEVRKEKQKKARLSKKEKAILFEIANYQKHYFSLSYGLIPLKDTASFSKSIKRLEKRGLIQSQKNTREKLKEAGFSLGKEVFIQLTKKGSQIVKEI